MSSQTLALFGGEKIIKDSFRRYNHIGDEELNAAKKVIESGVLSQFIGDWHPDFFGGPKVREFEQRAAEFFQVKHAITTNSWTSGLVSCVGAIGIEPGDEVIVTPWTMSATATAILHWNAIPVFADIDEKTFNIDPKKIEEKISPYTRAIVAVDIFGQSADMNQIIQIAKKYNLKVISDTAQAPGARYGDSYAGTCADVGGYSLNYHKHIHTGEGGIVVTNNEEIAERVQLIRNHGEVVAAAKGVTNISNLIGHNFRLGEIESAIGIEQLKKLPSLLKSRIHIAEELTKGLRKLEGLSTPEVGDDRDHVYYNYALKIEPNILGQKKERIFRALQAEGLPISQRYQNIHLLPMYQKKIAYGKDGFPWTSDICHRQIDYKKGICPIAEDLNDNRYLGLGISEYDFEQMDISNIIDVFDKVWSNLEKL